MDQRPICMRALAPSLRATCTVTCRPFTSNATFIVCASSRPVDSIGQGPLDQGGEQGTAMPACTSRCSALTRVTLKRLRRGVSNAAYCIACAIRGKADCGRNQDDKRKGDGEED
jgi:hypothetical protein